MLRAIREIEPTYVVGENVSGIVNWDGGLVFNEVQIDLEAEGYEVWPYVLPACAKNAPHRRDRVWFIAYNDSYSNSNGQHECNSKYEITTTNEGINAFCNIDESNGNGYATNTSCKRLQRRQNINKRSKYDKERRNDGNEFRTNCKNIEWNSKFNFSKFPTKPPICGGDDGLPREMDGITFSKWRQESIKAYGNAIVPQVAYEIFKAINEFELMVNK
jgi:DNA (cytosine-5)-methyltransferase 1